MADARGSSSPRRNFHVIELQVNIRSGPELPNHDPDHRAIRGDRDWELSCHMLAADQGALVAYADFSVIIIAKHFYAEDRRRLSVTPGFVADQIVAGADRHIFLRRQPAVGSDEDAALAAAFVHRRLVGDQAP